MINWENASIKISTTVLIENSSIRILPGESIGIIGANSTGKTILARAIAGQLPVSGDQNNTTSPHKLLISFRSSFKTKDGKNGYRQQRWNCPDPSITPTVKEELNKVKNQDEIKKLITRFNFEDRIDRFLISLSNGEQRKFELIKALASQPDLLIIDNAFDGLDDASRQVLSEMLNQLIIEQHSIVLTGLKVEEFPSALKKFITIGNKKTKVLHRSEILPIKNKEIASLSPLPRWENSSFDSIIRLNKVFLNYGEKKILNNITWNINANEKWVLSGSNGSGKTSLLNLIFGDNPKAYLCDIHLFGKKKGSGESIWDIKNKIGFVSPEMHQYLPANQTVSEVICSGFFDSEGLYQIPTGYQKDLAHQWLNMIDAGEIADQTFASLSSSTQCIILILRTLVKNPPLLILDEPFQGLDPENIQRMKLLLNQVAENTNCAMVFVSHFKNEIPVAFNLELKLNKGEMEYCGVRK
jgi:molybdate transport system ATP-binding protein